MARKSYYVDDEYTNDALNDQLRRKAISDVMEPSRKAYLRHGFNRANSARWME